MDDIKHPDSVTAGHIDVSSIKHCLQKGDAKLALQYCHELLADDPQHIQTLLFAALASRSLGWLDDALDFINRALTVSPSQPATHSLMGDILLLQKRPEHALKALLKAECLGDGSAPTRFNIGAAYLALDAFDDAKHYFDKALAIDPRMVAAHVNKGLAEHSMMSLDRAIDCFDSALRIDPNNIDAKWNKSHVLLTLGDYQAGFKLFEARWNNPKVRLKKRNFQSKLLLGQGNVSGKKVLLHAEGGFGDTLQFIRYAKLFSRDVSLIIQCQPPLINLFRDAFGDAHIIATGEKAPDHDFHCPVMSLPLAFGHELGEVPSFTRYIYPCNSLKQKWKPVIDKIGQLKIGVMVRGSGSFNGDKRSIELQKLERYLPSDAGFVLLQKELTKSENKFVASRVEWLAPCSDFSETAAICELLDAVVSVDTSVAHLAAAMGKPTVLLLPFRPDWRWGNEGQKTIWYPSCTLLRQPQHDDWNSIFKFIRPAITKIVS